MRSSRLVGEGSHVLPVQEVIERRDGSVIPHTDIVLLIMRDRLVESQIFTGELDVFGNQIFPQPLSGVFAEPLTAQLCLKAELGIESVEDFRLPVEAFALHEGGSSIAGGEVRHQRVLKRNLFRRYAVLQKERLLGFQFEFRRIRAHQESRGVVVWVEE